MSSYFELGNLIEGVNSTVTSGGTLALVASSKTMQRLTGTQSHTVTLPNATTFQTVGRRFSIKNRSTGSVTVNNFVGTLIATLGANTQRDFVVSDISTSAGVWELAGDNGTAGAGSASVQNADTLKLLQGLAAINYNDGISSSKVVKVNPEEAGADVWLNKTSIGTVTTGMGSFELGGYGYVFSGYSSPTILTTNQRYHDDNNYWQSRTAIGTASYDARGSVFNGYGYGMGGFTNVASTTTSSTNAQYSDLLDSWTSKTAMTESRADFASFVLGGYMFAACGTPDSSSFSSGVQAYSDTSNAWYVRSSYPDARAANRAFVLNDAAYSVSGFKSGGVYDALVYKYSSVFNTWIAAKSVSITSRASAAVFTSHGSGYVAGGYNISGSATVASTEQYNDFSNAWLTRASMSEDKYRQAPFVLGNFATIAGGNGSGGQTNLVSTYKNASLFYLGSVLSSVSVPTTLLVAAATKRIAADVSVQVRTDGDTWRLFSANVDSALKTGEVLKVKFAPTGLVYIVGDKFGSTTVEFYNDQANTWNNRASMTSAARGYGCGFAADGYGFYAGGEDNSSVFYALTDRYDDIANTWLSRAALPSNQSNGGSFSLNNQGYQCGGNGGVSGGAVVTVNQYNATNNAWATKASMSVGRRGNNGTSLLGFGYSFGGTNTPELATNEQYNDATNTWATKTSANIAKDQGPAFSLNQYAYFVNGFDGAGGTNTNQRYDQQANSWTTMSGTTTFTDYADGANKTGGFGYVFGGAGSYNGANKFNDAAGTWSSIANLNTGKTPGQAAGAFSPGVYRNYEMRVAIPAYIAGVGGGSWIIRANLTNGINTSNFNLNGICYHIGWNTGSERYSEANNTWTKMGAITSGSGEAYIPGVSLEGFGWRWGANPSQNITDRFSDVTGTWTQKANLPTAMNLNGSSTLNGYGYSMASSDAPSTANYQYNPLTDAWATKTSLTSGGGGGNLNMDALNGYVYYLNSDNTFRRYDDVNNAWTSSTAYPVSGLSYSFGAVLKGQLWVTGGYNGAGIVNVNAFNDATTIWSTRPSLPVANFAGGVCNLGGTLMQSGGGDTPANTQQFIPSLNDIILGVALEAK